jgi:hypothetical protein
MPNIFLQLSVLKSKIDATNNNAVAVAKRLTKQAYSQWPVIAFQTSKFWFHREFEHSAVFQVR